MVSIDQLIMITLFFLPCLFLFSHNFTFYFFFCKIVYYETIKKKKKTENNIHDLVYKWSTNSINVFKLLFSFF